MSDYIVRATAGNGQIRVFSATTKDIVEYARSVHNTSPVATAALGRLLTAGSIMGSMMKGDDDVLTLQIKSEGPIGGITVTADSKGNVKGYVNNPNVILPPNPQGKLDVGTAVGPGMLNIIKDMGLKEPYNSQTDLQTSEIAEDLTYYFAASEQVPSAVALGVLMEQNNTVKQAGGFIIQLMPFADEETISKLEEKLAGFTSITALLDKGYTPEMVLEDVLGDLGVEILERIPVKFHCNCSKDKVEKAIVSIGKNDLKEMIDDGEDITVNCHFCNTNYKFTLDELREIMESGKM